MKVKGVNLTVWIGDSGLREHRAEALNFVTKRGALQLASLPAWLIESLWFDRVIELSDAAELREESALAKALEVVRFSISKGLPETYPYPHTGANKRRLRVGSGLKLHVVENERRRCVLKGFVTRIDTTVSL